MANKLITDQGKTQMLRYAFAEFKYLALGDGESSGASGNGGDFSEVEGSNYQRVVLDQQVSDDTGRSITLTGTFDDSNYNPSSGGLVSEIGIVNNLEKTSNDVFFAYAEIPEIVKSDNISLKYTIVISVL